MKSTLLKLYLIFYVMGFSSLSEASTQEQRNNNVSILPFIITHPDKGPVPLDLNDRNTQNSIQTFYKLPLIFFPRLPFDFHYKKNSKGTFVIQNIGSIFSQFEIRIFGPDSAGRFAWIAKTMHPLECFSSTIKSTEIRGTLPIKYPKGYGYQKSHLIDLVFTPYPGENFTSNKSTANYAAEESCLNKNMLKALTQGMGFCAYRRILIYAKDTRTILQRQRGEFHKCNDRLTKTNMPIPTSSIFIGAKPDETRVYYLPENNPSSPNSLYERLYKTEKQKYKKPTYALNVVPKFEAKNSAHLFQPYVFDENKTKLKSIVYFWNVFNLAINLFPFTQSTLKDDSVNSDLHFLKKSKVPFSWNLSWEYTYDQIKTRIDNHTKLKRPYWNNFRLPILTLEKNKEDLRWIDADNNIVPIFPQTFTSTHVNTFQQYVSLSLLSQLINSPHATNKMRLAIAELCIDIDEIVKADEILKFLFNQITEQGTVSEGLWFLKLMKKHENFQKSSNDFDKLDDVKLSIVNKLKNFNSMIEDHVKLSHFNKNESYNIENDFKNIKAITEKNCRTLKNKELSPKKVYKLISLLSAFPKNQIEEFSLQDTTLISRECCWTTVAWLEDDSIDSYVSPDEYFWEYEKPFFTILKSLEVNTQLLKKLNLKNLTFKCFEEEEKLDYMNKIKETLCSVKFSELEELYLPHSSDRLNEEDNILFTHFLKLRKICYSDDHILMRN